MLASIPGEYITKAAMMLPDAISALNKPHHVEIRRRGRRIRITFKRFEYKRAKKTPWLWTADSAVIVDE
jgi:hypothetical protein